MIEKPRMYPSDKLLKYYPLTARQMARGFNKLAGVRSAYVSGNYAYAVSSGDSSLTIVDISNPLTPALKSEISDGVGGFMPSMPYPLQQSSFQFKEACNYTIAFYRINEIVKIPEYATLKNYGLEPLDELRIKMAKWLYN